MKNLTYVMFFILLCTGLHAETAILKNGETVRGICIHQTQESITMKLADGKTRVILKRDMYRLKFQDISDQEAARVRQEEEIRQKALAKMEQERAVADAKRKAELDQILAYEEKLRKQYDDEVARQIDEKIRDQNRGGRQALWRSAVIPGWGQWYQGHPIIGGAFLGAFAGSLLYTGNQYSNFSAAKSKYESHPGNLYLLASAPSSNGAITYLGYLQEKQALRSANRAGSDLALGGALTILIYGANLFHAYFFNARAVVPEQKSAGLQLNYSRVPLASRGFENRSVISFSFALSPEGVL